LENYGYFNPEFHYPLNHFTSSDSQIPEDLKKQQNIMKVAFVGCGLNSNYHINFAKDYPGIEIVGVVDKDLEKAKQCAAKYGIGKTFSTIKDLVNEDKPDVIHIITPPPTHYSLAKEAIEKKCHVLIEKPMALNGHEARELYTLAEEQGVKLCTMHNHFYDPCMAKARDLIDKGQVGNIINVESYYGLNTRIDAFRKYPSPNVLPWIYSLAGGVFHDFMAHPLYVALPYTGKPQEIQVMERSYGELPQNISDELRILIKGEKAFGVLTFSFAAKPHLHFLRIYGTKMMVNVDFNTMTTTLHPLSHLPKAAQKATYNLSASWQLFTNTVSNVWNFGRGKLRPYQGMKVLIHKYYDAINGKGEVPVSREEALMVVETMDEIFKQIKNTRLDFKPIIPMTYPGTTGKRSKILVTGATGFLGKRLVELLLQKGYSIRALARKLSNIEKLKNLNIEVCFGDVADVGSLKAVFEGIDYVIHAAADTSGSEEDGRLSTIQGTKNIIDLCGQFKVKKLIYISSCNVYGVADYKAGQIVTEESSLERFPRKRGAYSYSKLEAENIVRQAMKRNGVPIVCLRPGTIYGPGGEIFTPMIGFGFGHKLFAIIGTGKSVLPLIYIDNLVEGIVEAINNDISTGKVYNLVDMERLTKKEYLNLILKTLYPKAYYFYMPYTLLYLIVFLQEVIFRTLKRKPFLTRYRLTSSQKNVVYDSSKIRNDLGWKAVVPNRDAIDRILQYEQSK
jgi:predicted dehydrogenase/nucleoside-diphosphate-sugar epimerase